MTQLSVNVPIMLELVDLPNEKTIRDIASRYTNIQIDAAAIASALIFVKLGSEMLRYAEHYFNQQNLSGGRFSALMLLMRDKVDGIPSATPSHLAERAGVTRATMTGLIDGLEKDGYVRRKTDRQDKRRQTVEITAKGVKLIDKLYPPHLVRFSHLMDALSADEKKTFAQLIGKLRNRLCEVCSKPS